MKVAGCGLRFWSVQKYHGTRIDTARVERLDELAVLVLREVVVTDGNIEHNADGRAVFDVARCRSNCTDAGGELVCSQSKMGGQTGQQIAGDGDNSAAATDGIHKARQKQQR